MNEVNYIYDYNIYNFNETLKKNYIKHAINKMFNSYNELNDKLKSYGKVYTLLNNINIDYKTYNNDILINLNLNCEHDLLHKILKI